ncbi:MAG: heme exporter protein CcmB [Cytophagaceae bacterium]|nr:heme exporter protein CcmB [Cytophagaceae bacterium]
MIIKETIVLLQKEFSLEWKNRHIFQSLLLYLGSTIFIMYYSFLGKSSALSPFVWLSVYWLLLTFTTFNTVAKAFLGETAGRVLFYGTLVSAESLILSKLVYHMVLSVAVSLVSWLLFGIVFDSPVQDIALFLLIQMFAVGGFAAVITMSAGIAYKAGGNFSLSAILSFPILIPLIIMAVKASKAAMDGLDRSVSWDELILLAALNVITVAVSYLLFPYLWKA